MNSTPFTNDNGAAAVQPPTQLLLLLLLLLLLVLQFIAKHPHRAEPVVCEHADCT